ncbi:MAG: hypothetical protein Q4D60_00495 [Eubacteriales bacterium]|nr:hypothetical protein [Eubacteriales bacterium]
MGKWRECEAQKKEGVCLSDNTISEKCIMLVKEDLLDSGTNQISYEKR